MKREGGLNLRDHVRRVMRLLFHPSLMPRLNRSGTHGKEKFPEALEDFLKGGCMSATK